jgi:hypothetical protein
VAADKTLRKQYIDFLRYVLEDAKAQVAEAEEYRADAQAKVDKADESFGILEMFILAAKSRGYECRCIEDVRLFSGDVPTECLASHVIVNRDAPPIKRSFQNEHGLNLDFDDKGDSEVKGYGPCEAVAWMMFFMAASQEGEEQADWDVEGV